MPSSSPARNPRKWRYTWEALAHVPVLRLFLFHAEVNPSVHCANVAATFLPNRHQLVVSWSEGGGGGEEVSVTVPVPSVLVDVGSGVGVVAREDHVEVKLVLVLPVDHSIISDFRNALRSCRDDEMDLEDPSMPLSLDSDLKSLQIEDVHFYCKTCSTKLTRKCLRNFVELPSVDWKEVADNWFGACCCSFGSISEKLVSEYITLYACTEGTCLVDPASLTIFKDDLDGFIVSEDNNEDPRESDKFDYTDNHIVNDFGGCKIVSTYLEDHGNHNAIVSPSGIVVSSPQFENINEKDKVQDHISPGFLHQKGVGQRTDTKDKKQERQNPVSCMSPSSSSTWTAFLSMDRADVHHPKLNEERNIANINSALDSELYCPGFPPTELVSVESCHCCSGQVNGSLDIKHSCVDAYSRSQSMGNSTCRKSQISSHNGSLGSGFISRNSNMSDDVQWVEFCCWRCSSLIGTYPSFYDTNTPVDGGIRLFKCYISSSVPTSDSRDIFRKHTLQKVFVNLLLESAADELSFRTIVRDVSTKSAMLKLVIINSKVWCLTGYCFENEAVKSAFSTNLQPFSKVLFSDCNMESECKMRLEEWSTKNHAGEIFMLASQIKNLTESLKSAQEMLPCSCSVLQGMSLSFIES